MNGLPNVGNVSATKFGQQNAQQFAQFAGPQRGSQQQSGSQVAQPQQQQQGNVGHIKAGSVLNDTSRSVSQSDVHPFYKVCKYNYELNSGLF